MDAFILETLLSKGWRKGGEVFWTRADAVRAGEMLIRKRLAKAIRVLPVTVSLDPIDELPIIGGSK